MAMVTCNSILNIFKLKNKNGPELITFTKNLRGQCCPVCLRKSAHGENLVSFSSNLKK